MGRGTGRAIGVLAASCVLVAGLPAVAGAEGVRPVAEGSSPAEDDEGSKEGGPAPYSPAEDAQPVEGTASSTDGPLIGPGTYSDTLAPDGEKYYTIELDSTSDVYVSAVAAPAPGTKVGSDDEIEIELVSTGGDSCGDSWERGFGTDGFARPIAEYAVRPIAEDGSCQEAGTYLVKLTRDSDSTSTPAEWPVELRVMVEPPVASMPTGAPDKDDFSTEPPAAPGGTSKEVAGGTGFNDAPAIDEGVWKDRVRPGEVRFYRVPIDWGQQLFATAEIGNHPNPEQYSSSGGVRIELYNTARGYAGYEDTSYDGEQTRVSYATVPALYANRFSSDDSVSVMRFSGWYYLAVSLHPEAAEFVDDSVPFNLRLALGGKRIEGPEYSEDAREAGFGITEDDRRQAEEGLTQQQAAERDGSDQTLLAVAGLGLGIALLLALGVWTLVARRRAAAPVDAVPPPSPHGYAPPGGWR